MLSQRNILLIGMLSLLSACTVGPDYKRPSAPVPTQFKEAKHKHVIANKDWKLAQPRDDFDRGLWWKMFNDTELNKLEARLNISNQNIAVAYQNFMQACALVSEARASYYPTLNLSSSLTRQKSSSSSSFSSISSTGQVQTGSATATSGGGSSSNSNVFSSYALILNGEWTLDIWGLVRRTVEASIAGAQASADLLSSARLSAQASLAQYYFELRAVDKDQVILDNLVKNDKKLLKLTRFQYTSGVASRADVVQAQSQLETAQAQAINNKVARATYEHAIAVLIGVPPANFSLPSLPLNALPPPIPLVVPSALLERRPDIAQAERLMAQANAQIGVAVAAYYPSISLTGSLSDTGRGGLSQLLAVPTLGWAYGPQLAELIYDGGLRAATVAAARAGYLSTVASYRQVVLTAFQNVEDNLSNLRILAKEALALNKAVASAELALKLTINQYKSGTVPYSSVVTAQSNAFTVEKNAADVNGLRMTSAVGLITALGGGWHAAVNVK